MSVRFSAMIIGVTSLVTAAGSNAQLTKTDDKPVLGFSVAMTRAQQQREGPLFQRVKSAIAAANEREGAGFAQFLAPSAKLEVSWFDGTQGQKAPLTIKTIQAASNSCLGPYSFDEGSNWAQLSWICRVDNEAPISKHLAFRDSPELSLTVWFDDGLIKEISAMEPLPVPGWRRVSMNAYEVMKAKQ